MVTTLTDDLLPEYIKKIIFFFSYYNLKLNGFYLNSLSTLNIHLYIKKDGNGSKLEFLNESNPDLTMFPKLQRVLNSVNSTCAINVEIKYPYPVQVSITFKLSNNFL